MINPPGHYAPRECARCRGTGISLTRPDEQCPTCKGYGGVAVLQPAHKCARCGGNGVIKGEDVPCPSWPRQRLGFSLEGLMLRRLWPAGAIIIGARLLFSNFLVTTAFRESFFDGLMTPIGLILIVVGGYFLTKNFD